MRNSTSETAAAGTPYYIGKGCGDRLYSKHSFPIPKDKSRIQILFENLSEDEAFILEMKMISQYGRKDLNTGILINRTNGGEGSSGRIVSVETRNKIRENKPDQSGEKNGMFGVRRFGSENPFYGKKQTQESIDRSRANRPDTSGANNVNFGKKGPLSHFYGKSKKRESIEKSKQTRAKNITNGKVYKSPANTIWIKHPIQNITKMISPDDLDSYSLQGFVKGRGRTRPPKI